MHAQEVKREAYGGLGRQLGGSVKKTIDMWPIVERGWADGEATMSLLLMFGTILHKTDIWTKATRLRVCTVVETQRAVDGEVERLKKLLHEFRIDAEIRVFALEDACLPAYEELRRHAGQDGVPGFFWSLPRMERHAVLNELLQSVSTSTSVLFLPLFQFPGLDRGMSETGSGRSGTAGWDAAWNTNASTGSQLDSMRSSLLDGSMTGVRQPTEPMPSMHGPVDHDQAEQYWKEMAMLSAGLPPTLMVHAVGQRVLATEI